jgi:rhamnosyltransferase
MWTRQARLRLDASACSELLLSDGLPFTVGVAVLTYNAEKLLPQCLPPLLAMQPRPRILIVDSSSRDGTLKVASDFGVETIVIPQSDFNHGTTREFTRKALGTDIVVMMTHDAIATGTDMISNLTAPIQAGKAAVSYARQLPHDGADFFESFPREFNYPAVSELRCRQDIPRLGPQTFFCSNSCCAWLNSALDKVGGFERTLTSEDALTAAKLVHAGFGVAYRADALVKHSHSYTLKEEFKRYFDTGYVRSLNSHLLFAAGGDERRGVAMVKAMVAKLWRSAPWNIPYALLTFAAKLFGYRAGYYSHSFPLWLKRKLSSQPYFWKA